MLIIPAIDLKDGFCVRLKQGKKEEVTKYSDDPVKTAQNWVNEGADLIHIVDLDGAFTGTQKNLESIKQIRKNVSVAIELGGGIRDIDTISKLIALGIDRIIIGTAAITNPEFLRKVCEKYPGKILTGIDAKDGKVAVKGWQEITEKNAIDLAKEAELAGTHSIIYTDIARDGMLSGPNIEATQKIVESLSIPVIASGGISSMNDIENLTKIKKLFGAITGKAIYSGAIELREAINKTRDRE
ncbi:MAG: 1-(5-phosphoribosyl)-5-[(5-phosphoribosylamino)methylideneamino]imidazole-4-carboxamide isomerase [Candidatus Magnetoovum sp. WYHC-5]|nr:1-(5-phosphoribosyl)-5-[(5-phosphoribosylamino)methylideneamino]imidazole-4-carboxamide isomerase [Candidatus Magnetoovum sp. WYHC-5]